MRREYCSLPGSSCTLPTENCWSLSTALFWAITQRVVVIPYRRFGVTYRSLLCVGNLNSCTVLKTAFTVRIYSIMHQYSTSDTASITLTGKYSWIYNHPSRFWRWAFCHLFGVANEMKSTYTRKSRLNVTFHTKWHPRIVGISFLLKCRCRAEFT